MSQTNEPMDAMDALSFRLLNEFQRNFPLTSTPYAEIARQLGIDETEALRTLRRLRDEGAVSRVGAVFSPRRIGASTLAALMVPPERLDAVADEVSAHPEVNHNYEREHAWNLWFVATAPDETHLDRVLAEIAAQSGCPSIRLPLEEEFHIDLGFDLASTAKSKTTATIRPPRLTDGRTPLSVAERQLMAALQDGLPLESRPYAIVAEHAGTSEGAVLQRLRRWIDNGVIKRLGIIVRHHELGWTANAMCVWNVPDAQATTFGRRLAEMPGVTLCYRRARDLPSWPYNLYCMIHGRERGEVESRIAVINDSVGLSEYPHTVLFSLHRYKQRGARYAAPEGTAHA